MECLGPARGSQGWRGGGMEKEVQVEKTGRNSEAGAREGKSHESKKFKVWYQTLPRVKWFINKTPSGKLSSLMEIDVHIFCTRSEELRLRAKVAIRQTDYESMRAHPQLGPSD